jgi:hypothetical protein
MEWEYPFLEGNIFQEDICCNYLKHFPNIDQLESGCIQLLPGQNSNLLGRVYNLLHLQERPFQQGRALGRWQDLSNCIQQDRWSHSSQNMNSILCGLLYRLQLLEKNIYPQDKQNMPPPLFLRNRVNMYLQGRVYRLRNFLQSMSLDRMDYIRRPLLENSSRHYTVEVVAQDQSSSNLLDTVSENRHPHLRNTLLS